MLARGPARSTLARPPEVTGARGRRHRPVNRTVAQRAARPSFCPLNVLHQALHVEAMPAARPL
eukprot:2920024-Alexandrium_andersonii.AAC.1